METWYYRNDGCEFGPFPDLEFVALVREGHIGREDLVWTAELGGWRRAGDVPGLFPPTTGAVSASHPPLDHGTSAEGEDAGDLSISEGPDLELQLAKVEGRGRSLVGAALVFLVLSLGVWWLVGSQDRSAVVPRATVGAEREGGAGAWQGLPEPVTVPVDLDTPLDLGSPAGAYTNSIYPVGWSPDGRYVAYLYQVSGGSAVADGLKLVVQDLVDDSRPVDDFLTSREPDEDPDVRRVRMEYGTYFRDTFRQFGLVNAGADLMDLPYWEDSEAGTPLAVQVGTEYIDGEPKLWSGPISGLTVTLHQDGGAYRDGGESKVVDRQSYEYGPFEVAVVGALRGPASDRIAVVVREVRGGFEGDRIYTYRLVGAGVGPAF